MTEKPNLKPPDHVCGQTVLNKTLFEKTITVPCLVVKGVKISTVIPIVKKYLLKLENFKPVKTINEQEAEIFFNPELVNNWNDLSVEDQKSLQELSFNENNLVDRSHTLTYENYNVESILRAILPKNVEGSSSFTKIGHIVHLNLREHLIPYKDIIGEVLFDKVPGCRTVVNKVAIIDNTYRNFQMEVLKGDNDMHTKVKENKCTFEFDFSKVYWNSRLCTEHERIVNMVKSGDVLFDVFAGVGPFSIPIAKKGCLVYANDLNPESYKWLNHNSKINKIGNNLKTFNKDGREFILGVVKELLLEHLNKRNVFIVMNLPAMAVEFLNAFINLYKEEELKQIENPPIVIVYCFAKGEDYESIAKKLLFDSIGFDIGSKIIEIFRVRTVSSLKEMMRIVFKLDRDILSGLKTNLPHKRKHAHDDSISVKKCNDFDVTMGKNKKKTNSVFKVAGAKSLKLKAKAKAVKTELKQINIKNKSKILEVDKELVNLQEKLRNTAPQEKKEKSKSGSKLPSKINSNSDSNVNVEQLNAMQL
ncbi:tRNA (guanine(37)-N1)-methyltransferase [Asbolus verrucosus]|uniref:tRNA (guanine(37)-N1)-methyltransferase n=1 Tax=Asbolus verrucosus TaxID=1661398 RepID=A0A482VGH6_ASBVE|nr:tRNA (guanine(37)-N1)-methyltransferase [Asbolus verrucosus]